MIIDIKQYLKETNSVLLSEQAYKYLKEKASVIEELEEIKTEMDIIEELEAIKEEMDNKGWYNRHDKEQFAEIVDNHISELKGENK